MEPSKLTASGASPDEGMALNTATGPEPAERLASPTLGPAANAVFASTPDTTHHRSNHRGDLPPLPLNICIRIPKSVF
jgi:hypothetical protein